eukprot:846312_1
MTPHTMGIEAHLIHNSLGKCYIDGCNQSESNHQRIDREKVNYVFNVHCRRIVELDALHTYVRTALNHTKYMQLRIDTTHNHTMALKRICEGDIGHCVSLNRIVMSLACNYCPNLDPKTPSGLERNTKKSVESKSLISGYFVHLLQLK